MVLKDIVRAIYDKSFYKERENDTFGRRFGVMYLANIFLMVVFSIGIFNFYSTNKQYISEYSEKILNILPDLYPEDLIMTVENGELSTNYQEPFSLGQELLDAFDSSGKMSGSYNLLTIDTEGSIEDFDSYGTILLVTKKGIGAKQSTRGETRFYPFTQFMTDKNLGQKYTFDSKAYSAILKELSPFMNQVPSMVFTLVVGAIIITVLFGPLLLITGWLFSLTILSILGLVAGKVIKRGHSYGYIYKMGMYLTIPLSLLQNISVIAVMFGVSGVPDLSGFTWLVYLLLIAVFIPQTEPVSAGFVSPLDPPVKA